MSSVSMMSFGMVCFQWCCGHGERADEDEDKDRGDGPTGDLRKVFQERARRPGPAAMPAVAVAVAVPMVLSVFNEHIESFC
jgi:hypothetical protein